MSIFFVLGTGRCGTTTLARALSSAPDCMCLHEGVSSDLGVTLSPLIDEFRPAYESLDSTAGLAALFGRERADFFRNVAAEGCSVGEANHFAYPFIDYLRCEFPDARFIHLIRNGYDTVVSWEGAKRRMYPKPGKGSGTRPEANPVPDPADRYHDAWDLFDRRRRIIWFWGHVNDFIAGKLQAVSRDSKMTVRLEELNEGKMNEIVDFLGVSRAWDRGMLVPHNRSTKPLRRRWTQTKLRQFGEIAGDVMERFGYRVFDDQGEFDEALGVRRLHKKEEEPSGAHWSLAKGTA